MSLWVVPGMHPPELTRACLQALAVPARVYAGNPTDARATATWLAAAASPPTVLAFSAGVVGAAGAIALGSGAASPVRALLAVDGWGVPLLDERCHRFSHDAFTHWSSALLRPGAESFYCDPPVAHLDLWRAPDRARGWFVPRSGWRVRTTAADALRELLARYERC